MQLRLAPGRKGLRKALGDVPSWVAFQDREKVEVCFCPFTLHSPFQTLYTYLWKMARPASRTGQQHCDQPIAWAGTLQGGVMHTFSAPAMPPMHD